RLKINGWCCCWGSTIDAVDFCKKDGSLIQIKNSDNSENSSSSRVRAGTTIKKWYRRKSTKQNTFFWNNLHAMVDRTDLTEDDFRDFVKATVKKNPNCLYIIDKHPLKS
ncbi:MAG TPA: SinI family restriction endonuclease, partial [Bacteroidia bacterium]|nr:SinI family restriction endonuclease [Bacteroidia bacterium]